MATTTTVIKTIIQFRRATNEDWLLNKDVIPHAGEPCFNLDLKTLKIGDGVTTYENLPVIGGADISADGKSIILEDDTFKLAGFNDAEIGAQPRKNAAGNIEWVVPSNTDLERLKTDVATLQDIVTPSGAGTTPLLTRVETLENKVDNIGTQGNIIESVKINGVLLDVIDKSINIPVATNTSLGVVKTSEEITVANDGALGIGSVSFSKIVQTGDEIIILDGGYSD